MLDALGASRGKKGLRPTDALWALLVLAVHVAVFAWYAQGLVVYSAGADGLIAPFVLSCTCVLGVHVCFVRRAIARGVLAASAPSDAAAYHVVSLVLAVIALLVAGGLSVLALEIPQTASFGAVDAPSVFVEWQLVCAALLALYFLGQRRCALAVLVPLACTGFGIAEYFVLLFKGQPIQPGDLLAIGTAAAVADGYVYTLAPVCLQGIACGVGAIALLAVLSLGGKRREALFARAGGRVKRPSCEKEATSTLEPVPTAAPIAPGFPPTAARNAGVLANLAVGLVLVAVLVTDVTTVDYRSELGIEVSGWEPATSYSSQAYIPTFIAACQQMRPVVPSGYDEATAAELLDAYAAAYDGSNAASSEERVAAEQQFSQTRPTVIAVMNESFSDLSIFNGLFAGYEGPEYFKSIPDCVQRGVFYTSVQGGGTTNSEFEFLTGCSMAGFGTGVYPYNLYDLTRTENLAGVFKSLGYDTLAMHPNSASNWNRKNVYKDLGFDDFLSIEDFAGADTLRGMVTDRATYDKVLEALSTNPDPQFIFDVTMQNHSGYDSGLIPDDEMLHLSVDGTSGDEMIDEYVTVIQRSDEDLQYFIERLRELDRPVVLVFFGDHQPYITPAYNDAWYTGEDTASHQVRVYQTSYFIWANYDLAGSEQESAEKDLSASFLSSEVMQAIGAPLTQFMKAHEAARESLSQLTAIFYQDAAGTWHNPDEVSGVSATDQALSDFLTIQYKAMFGGEGGIYTRHMQEEANV